MADPQTETLDIDTPEGARRYIALTATSLIGRQITYVDMACGERIEFIDMTDEQAVRVARSLYLDIT